MGHTPVDPHHGTIFVVSVVTFIIMLCKASWQNVSLILLETRSIVSNGWSRDPNIAAPRKVRPALVGYNTTRFFCAILILI